MNKQPNMTWLYVFLGIFGLIFASIGGFFSFYAYDLVSNGEKNIGVVKDHETRKDSDGNITYAPKVQYVCNGVEQYNASRMSSSFKYDINEKVEIYCDPKKPEKFIMNSFMNKYFGLFFFIPGIIVLLIPIFLIIFKNKRKKMIEHLKTNGALIKATIIFVGENTNVRVNKKHPFVIKAELNQAGTLHKFKSDNIWFDITDKVKIGDEIDVYVLSEGFDGYDYSKYWIDTSI